MKNTDDFSCDDSVYTPIGNYFNQIINSDRPNELLVTIWYSLCQTLGKLSDLSVADWNQLGKVDGKRIDVEFNFDFQDGNWYAVKLFPKQKVSVKALGKYPNTYEIILDFTRQTATNRIDENTKKPLHSNSKIKELAENYQRVLRIFISLGEIIDIPSIASNTRKEYQTYQKIVYCLFDKTGLSKDDYNLITDRIGEHIENLTKIKG